MRKSLFKPLLGNIAIVLIAFAFVLSADARTVSLEEAMSKAQRFLYSNSADSVLLSRGTSAQTFKLAYEAKTANKAATCFYVLNRPSSEGYIIMSADDRLPEVLGYSDNGEFDINNIPDNMKWWLSEYERQIEQVLAASNDDVMPIADTSFRDGWTKIEPMMGTQWKQSNPYNNQCPTINGERTLTGCVATAMAQIMNHHQWPATGKGSHSYEWNGQTLSMDFSNVTFDWENMLDACEPGVYEYDFDGTITDDHYLAFTNFERSGFFTNYIQVSKLTNITDNELNGKVQLLLTDNDGKVICPIGEKYDVTNLSPESELNWESHISYYHVPSDLPDGSYRMYLAFNPNGSTEWSMAQRATDGNDIFQPSTWEEYYINISKTGEYYTIGNSSERCSPSKVQVDAVATLMYACGISVNMYYDLEGSGAFAESTAQALKQYFDYDTKYLYRSSDIEDSYWEDLIYTELQNSRPVLYAGDSWTTAHAFVCDGYDGDGLFHINWGWGGYLDGNFLLSVLDPYGNGNGFAFNQDIIYGICPNNSTTVTVSVGADGLATYCPVVGVDFSDATGIAAYKGAVNGNTVTLTKVNTVAAGEGVLLRSLNGGAATEYLPVAETATKNEGNAFVGVLEDITLSETTGDYTNFVLSKVDGAVGFFKANNTTVAAGKAYLPVENYTAGARSLNIVFDDETTTGISEVENKQATAADDAIYTLSGTRVKNPAKGIYIKNGKKVIVK